MGWRVKLFRLLLLGLGGRFLDNLYRFSLGDSGITLRNFEVRISLFGRLVGASDLGLSPSLSEPRYTLLREVLGLPVIKWWPVGELGFLTGLRKKEIGITLRREQFKVIYR